MKTKKTNLKKLKNRIKKKNVNKSCWGRVIKSWRRRWRVEESVGELRGKKVIKKRKLQASLLSNERSRRWREVLDGRVDGCGE